MAGETADQPALADLSCPLPTIGWQRSNWIMPVQQLASIPENLDLIWGASAIAVVIGTDVRSAFYMLERGMIPAQKIGRQWCASRSALAQHFAAALTGKAA